MNTRSLKRLCAVFVGILGVIGPRSVIANDVIETIVLKAGLIHIGDGSVIENGEVLVAAGRIVAVGHKLDVPQGAKVIEYPNGSITPGLIDANAALESIDMANPAGYRLTASEVAHSVFCKTDHHEPAVGCCGSKCSRAIMHADGKHCKECGFPNKPPDLSLGTRTWHSSSEQSSEVIPETRVLDSVNLRSPDFGRLVGGGVTTVFAAPDSAAVISSQGAILRTAGSFSDRVIREADAVKASMGTDPSWKGNRNRLPFRSFVDFHSRRPTTRMGVTWVFRKSLHDTRRHAQGMGIHGADSPSEPAMDILKGVLDGRTPLRIQARQQNDIAAAIRLAGEFGLSFVLEEATEAHRCIDMLKANSVPVVYGPIYVNAPGYRARSREVSRARLHTMRVLVEAGVEVALTAQELREEDGLARQAMYALRYGVEMADVMKAVTLTPARILGIEDEVGTLEVGKRADLVLWKSGPFAATSEPIVVWSGGEIVVDRRKEKI